MSKLDEFLKIYVGNLPRVRLKRIFYFDESNNIRKGKVGEERDNNDDLENLYFTLGGIAIKKPIEFQKLLDYIGAKQKPVDAKYDFFTLKNKKFIEAIAQRRLRKFFEYLNEEDIIIHFAVEHYFHFALVDILDSLIEESDYNQEVAFRFYKELQSDMTEVLYNDFNSLHRLLVNYEFPNIHKDKANDFIRAILDLYNINLNNYYDLNEPNNFTKELLRQIIKSKRHKNNLVFLENNEPYVISDSMSQLYLQRMYNFQDKKLFDNEPLIETALRQFDKNYEVKLNAKFCDSANLREIQICDAISGFVGRLFNFLSKTDENKILRFVKELDKESESFKTLKAFFDLIEKSDKESEICFLKINPLYIDKRFDVLRNEIENR